MNSTFENRDCDFVLSEEDAILYHFTIYKKLFILLVVPTVVAFGLFGNAALLFVLYRVENMRTITNFYLSNLAVSDGILLINAAVRYIWAYVTQPIDFSWSSFPKGYLCALSGLLAYLCYFTSVFLVILVTFERYLAICHPLTHRLVKGKNRTARMIASVWFISLVMACLWLDVHEVEKICIDWPDSDDYNGMSSHFITCKSLNTKCSWCGQTLFFLDFCQFALAVIVSTFMYGRIIHTLTTRSGGFTICETDSDKKTTTMMFRDRNQIARMLVLNGTVLFLCLAPYEVVNLNWLFYWWAGSRLFDEEKERYFIWLGRIAMLMNSAINPILYNVSNQRYRNAFAETFRCIRVCNRKTKQSNNSNCVEEISTWVKEIEMTSWL